MIKENMIKKGNVHLMREIRSRIKFKGRNNLNITNIISVRTIKYFVRCFLVAQWKTLIPLIFFFWQKKIHLQSMII